MSRYVKRGQVYTLHQIYFEMELDDFPHLGFHHEGRYGAIQQAHYTTEELAKKHPRLLFSQWCYERVTSERIPIFSFAGDLNALLVELHLEPGLDFWSGQDTGDTWWATPKTLLRQQPSNSNLMHYEHQLDQGRRRRRFRQLQQWLKFKQR